ncbi:uncharacterized protein LOC127287899 [Leptopilina boulardi]|uniref:uncharacterized protein LOC127287899 n=1 Tax=Leptopilina boulardi TaxID=63433 RepID=UPI0021F66539|nr:uncharacterized protein LOC127287899 [Leptopilina boulardi]
MLHEKVETIAANQTKLNLYMMPNEKVMSRPAGLPILPLKNSSELQVMENYLKKNDDNVFNTSIYLSNYVFREPNKEKRFAMRLMKHIFNNTLGAQFNFKGQGEKRGFEALTLWQVLKGAAALKLESSDLHQFEAGVKSWLKDVPWRDQQQSLKNRN